MSENVLCPKDRARVHLFYLNTKSENSKKQRCSPGQTLCWFELTLVVQLGFCTSWPRGCPLRKKLQKHGNPSNTDMRSLVHGGGLAKWHFNQPSQSFLTNEYVSVWPKRACAISPSFYLEDAGWRSYGLRSTLSGDRQTASANKMECSCISHLCANINTSTHWHCDCSPPYTKHCSSTIARLCGIDDNSMWAFWPTGSNQQHNPPTV